MVLTLLEKSAVEREWKGSDGLSRNYSFFWAPRPAVGRYQKALEALVRKYEHIAEGRSQSFRTFMCQKCPPEKLKIVAKLILQEKSICQITNCVINHEH